MTWTSNPYVNYTANDLNAQDTLRVQTHELAHSLQMITGAATRQTPPQGKGEPGAEEGSDFLECVDGRYKEIMSEAPKGP
jgi:hypothetical protein